jgi:alcohol dehydrogenase
MKHFYGTRIQRYVDFAGRVFDVPVEIGNVKAAALEGIQRFETFLKDVGVPVRLGEIGVDKDALEMLTDEVVKISFGADGNLRSRPPATREDVMEVYRLAL